MTGRAENRGFTLLEVLIAFAILAVSLGAIFQAFSSGLTQISRAERAATAALQARSLMAEVGTVIPLAAGETSGSFDDEIQWRIDIAPYEEGGEVGIQDFGVTLYEVKVVVSDDKRDIVSLKTLRLGEPP
ncbi:MAG: prepilin-type N-terminal cleavage/methylation domain-containing protein [Pseudomonadota bacterium]